MQSPESEKPRRRKKKRHPGTLVLRGSSYWLHLSIGGKRHYFTIHTIDRQEAEQFAIDKARELEQQLERRRRGLPGGIRISDLLELFEREQLPPLAKGTRDAYRDSLKAIRQFFITELADPSLERIRAKDVTAFLSWRRVHRLGELRGGAKRKKATTVSNRTLQKDRAVLHRVFAIAENLEYRDGNPVSRVDPPKADSREPVILSAAEYERLIAACSDRPLLELYVLTLGEAGLRCESEALRLRWDDVDLDGGFLWISTGREGHRTKTGKGRHVPMTPRLAAAMRRHFADRRFSSYAGERPDWVFHHPTTRGTHVSGARVGSLRHSFKKILEQAKLPTNLRQHDLRHRRVTTWLAEGRDVTLVKEAMGHADLRTTMSYTHLAREHLRALVDDQPAEAAADSKAAG